MIGYSVSQWGIFLTPDNEIGENILSYPHRLEKLDDDLPMRVTWPMQFPLPTERRFYLSGSKSK